ncbi:CvpA family protein [Sphingomonas sp. MMS24-JH45]
MNLHGLDIVILLTVGATALYGAMRGFVAEVLALFAWVAMVFAVKIAHLPLAERLSRGRSARRRAPRCCRSRSSPASPMSSASSW